MGFITDRNIDRIAQHNIAVDPTVPLKNMVIDINTTCNQNCVFCTFTCIKQNKTIEPKLMYKILEEAFQSGVREVGLSLSGEPLLNKNLCDYIKRAKEIGYEYIFLSTNGMEKNIDRYKEIIESGLDSIKFSIHASDAERYKKIHGVDNFDNVVNIVKLLYKWRKETERKFYLFAFCTATQYTMNDGIELQKMLGDFTDEIMLYPVSEGSCKIKGIKELLCTSKSSFDDIKIPCPYPFSSISISADGFMTTCCEPYGQLAVADLNKMSIYDAWHSEEYKNFRQRMINGDIIGLQCELCINGYGRDSIKPFDQNLGKIIDFNLFDATDKIKDRFELEN